MITTNLTGNLGNHMWQYSVLRSIAEYNNFEWGINPSPTHDYHKGMNQMYFMEVDFGKEIFGIKNQIFENWIYVTHENENINVTITDENLLKLKDETIILGKDGALGAILQSEKYFELCNSKVENWFKIKKEYEVLYEEKMRQMNIVLDDDVCVINFRGGEYRGIPKVVCRKEYWRDSIEIMKKNNPNMKFIIITDDISFAKSYMPFDIDAYHVDIGFDFYVLNKCKWSIISNSSFGWWASWLNSNSKKILAPKYWATHNFSDGYWGVGEVYTKKFSYVDRSGIELDYETCKMEADEYYIKNKIK